MFDLSSFESDLKKKMSKSVSVFKSELAGFRAGRASAGLLERVTVDAYDSKMPLNQVATVSVKDSRSLVVSVWDVGLVSAVEKGIIATDSGLNPMREGPADLRINLPELSEERRQDMVKLAKKKAEETRVSVRRVRHLGLEQLRKLLKDASISENEMYSYSNRVQKLTDEYVSSINDLLDKKTVEIMKV